jgi:tetratricopeptide (TPR) repeat protein
MKQGSARYRAERHQQWLQRVDAAQRTYGLETAARLALEALADGVEHPAILNLAASAHYREGRHEEAAQLLKRARKMAPRDPNVLNSLGLCLNALGRADEALEAFDGALRAEPRMAAAHFNRGVTLEEINDGNRARSAYEQAIALDPNHVEALASIAWLDTQTGRFDSARSYAERALARSPSNVLARMALAAADLARNDLKAAGPRLSELLNGPPLTPANRSIVLGLIGDFNDAVGSPAESFAAYEASNAELKGLYAGRFDAPGKETALAHVRSLTGWFEAADRESWNAAPPGRPRAADPREHVFLVGFPRSGTTLLENVLAAHPDVVTLEEKDSLAIADSAYLSSSEGLQRLARIGSSEAHRQREIYWSAVRKSGVEPRGRVFIDKMPLASVQLPVVAKLFPDARVLFAIRDPRDIVLSCFRRRFGMNPSMYQLLTLEGAAAFYDAVMRLSEIYSDLLPLARHVVRYEDLVEDFEVTARAACDFIGIEWNQEMLDFAAKARSRGISTPSAAQVAGGLNREGQGAWRRYRKQMEPVLPLLQPWLERFGYASE